MHNLRLMLPSVDSHELRVAGGDRSIREGRPVVRVANDPGATGRPEAAIAIRAGSVRRSGESLFPTAPTDRSEM
jgi:hypothetical protein